MSTLILKSTGKKNWLKPGALIFLLMLSGFSAAFPREDLYKNTRVLALGGTGTSYFSDATDALNNPAGPVLFKKNFFLGTGLSADFGDIWGITRDGQPLWEKTQSSDLEDLESLAGDSTLNLKLNKFDQRPWEIRSLPEVFAGFVSREGRFSRAFYLHGYMASTTRMMAEKGIYIPSAKGIFRNTLSIRTGMAASITPEYHIGISPFLRGIIIEEQSVSLDNYSTVIDSISQKFQGVKSELKRPALFPGLDLGLLYTPEETLGDFSFGFVLEDIPLNFISKLINPEINVGLSYAKQFDLLKGWPLNLLLASEFLDITGGQAFWRIPRLGFDLKFNFLAFRTGIASGYPSLGAGLIFPGIALELTYWVRELGTLPGQQPEPHLMASIKVGIF